MEDTKLHIALLSSPGMGHIIPILLLGKHLVTRHNLNVTVLVVTTNTSAAESQLLDSNNLPIIKIPPPDISSLIDQDATVVTRLCVMMRAAVPGIRSAISSMDPRPDVLVGDLFSVDAWPVAEEFNIPKYTYIPTTAWFAALSTYCHVLDKVIVGEYVDQPEPLKIPGCKPVRPEDVVDPMLDRTNQQYREYVLLGIGYTIADGILMNTWEDLERTSIDALRNNEMLKSVVTKPVYPIGPILKEAEPSGSKSEIVEWLDSQPKDSVIYVSFGSGGTLSANQLIEVAWGLELSQQRFIWVVRPPTSDGSDASFFTTGSSGPGANADYFPDGFLTRTRQVGFIVPQWAPQVEILNHPSVGGFLTHCGWNSTLESISGGVPMIAWPLYAEQRLNATLLAEELKVAVRPKVLPTKKVVERDEIESMVRTLMQSEEGTAMREKVKKLRDSAEKAMSVCGSSYNAMCDFIRDCRIP